MFKELNGINTLGLTAKNMTGRKIVDYLWNNKYKSTLHKQVIDHVNKSCFVDDNFKEVDERLDEITGVYELPAVAKPYWVDDFIQLFTSYATLENLLISKGYSIVNKEAKCEDFFTMTNALTEKLKEADYVDGLIEDDSKRQVKIMKYIKQQLAKFVTIPDKDFDATDFVKHYIKYKEASKPLHLVITNSVPSFIGMSSFAPDKGGSRVWTSCQSVFASGSDYTKGLLSNITDKGSLICYVTDGTSVKAYGAENRDFDHQVMLCRNLLRLMYVPDKKKYTLVLDRAYPNAMYTPQILSVLKELAKEIDVEVSMHLSYNSAQNGKDYFEEYRQKLIKNIPQCEAESAHPIFISSHYDGASGSCMGNCGNCGKFRQKMCEGCENSCLGCNIAKYRTCGMCKNYDVKKCYKLYNDYGGCNRCPNNSLRNNDGTVRTIHGHTHYDDQIGVTQSTASSRCKLNSDNTYKCTYTLYYGITKNIPDAKKEKKESA